MYMHITKRWMLDLLLLICTLPKGRSSRDSVWALHLATKNNSMLALLTLLAKEYYVRLLLVGTGQLVSLLWLPMAVRSLMRYGELGGGQLHNKGKLPFCLFQSAISTQAPDRQQESIFALKVPTLCQVKQEGEIFFFHLIPLLRYLFTSTFLHRSAQNPLFMHPYPSLLLSDPPFLLSDPPVLHLDPPFLAW